MKSNPTHIICNEAGKPIINIHSRTTSYGALIHLVEVISEIGPEELAMVQALASRSPASIVGHLKEVILEGAEKFMAKFYKGYGHNSIGDLGHIIIALEGISMLATKAIQDTQMYSGQESSTRYINFDKQPFLSLPDDFSTDFKWIQSSTPSRMSTAQEKYRLMYQRLLPGIQDDLFIKYPWEEQDQAKYTQDTYERAIKARSFDIVRGILPAGATTMVCWDTSIRQASDHLMWLRCHVLDEVCELAKETYSLLESVYPASFEGRIVYPKRETFKQDYYKNDYYLEEVNEITKIHRKGHFSSRLFETMLLNYKHIIMSRPIGQELPYQIGECGVLFYENLLDYGSFRDQQRHRPLAQRQGLLTEEYGFHPWYRSNLPDNMKGEVQTFLTEHLREINSWGLDKFQKQYFLPMGMRIPTRLVGPIGKMLYLVELRAQTTVHPTMHANAYELGVYMLKELARILGVNVTEIPMNLDKNVGAFSLKRGTQTIFKQGEAV